MAHEPLSHLLQRSSKEERDLYYREIQLLSDIGKPTDRMKKATLETVWLAVRCEREITREDRLRVQAMRIVKEKPPTPKVTP